MNTDTRPLFPLRFGDSAKVREWEDRIAHEEAADAAREAGLTVLTENVRNGIYRRTWNLLDPDSFQPDPGDILRPMYDLIFDEDQEPRSGMEELGEAYERMQLEMASLQKLITDNLETP